MLHAYALAWLGAMLPHHAPKPPPVADLSVFLKQKPPPAPPREIPPPAEPTPPRRDAIAPETRASVRKSPSEIPKKQRKKPANIRPLYPLEAVARGIEGDVLVRVVLDEKGDVVASRLEASSGHAILDEAALHAARTLRGLPDAMAREAVLPVRFRLR